MNLVDLLSKTANLSRTSVGALKVYPLEEESQGSITAKNIALNGNKLTFDLITRDLELTEYDFVKVLALKESDRTSLQRANFPSSLTGPIQSFLFSADERQQVYVPREQITNIQIPIDNLQGDRFTILVSFSLASILNGDVFALSFNASDIVESKKSLELENQFLIPSRKEDDKTFLESLVDKTYISNLNISYSQDGTLSGFYAVDANKLLFEFTKFPNLINVEDPSQFSNFLYKTEVTLTQYDKKDYGYNFENSKIITVPILINNLRVLNSGGKYFYNFDVQPVNSISDFEAKIKFHFNDITINLANDELINLRTIRDEQQRTGAAQAIINLYGDDIPEEYINNLSNIDKLSDVAFKEFMDKIISDIAKEIDNAKEKNNSKSNAGSQYTSPKPALHNNYEVSLEQKFQRKIKLRNNKQNKFYNLNSSSPFKSISVNDFTVSPLAFITTQLKTFLTVPQIKPITKFSSLSVKDDLIEQSGLDNKVNCSDEDERAEQKLAISTPSENISLSTTRERKVQLFYLDAVGDTTSALIFREAPSDLTSLIPVGEKVLVRLDNYEEFYDSYFYVVNEG